MESLLDILNRLPEPKRAEMMTLVQRFRSRQISIQEFLNISQGLLGEQLYAVLVLRFSTFFMD